MSIAASHKLSSTKEQMNPMLMKVRETEYVIEKILKQASQNCRMKIKELYKEI